MMKKAMSSILSRNVLGMAGCTAVVLGLHTLSSAGGNAYLGLIPGGLLTLLVGVHHMSQTYYAPNGFSNSAHLLERLAIFSDTDLDYITDTDWLFLLAPPKNITLPSNHWETIGKVLSPERLGRINKKVLAKIIAGCPDKTTRIRLSTHLSALKAPSI